MAICHVSALRHSPSKSIALWYNLFQMLVLVKFNKRMHSFCISIELYIGLRGRTCDVMLILLHSNASKHNGHSQPIDQMRDERKTNSEILVRGLLFICTIHSSSRCNESGARDHTDTTLTFQMIIHNNNQPELTEWNAPWKLCGRMSWMFNIETQQKRSVETMRPKHFPVKSISSKVKRNVMVVVLVDDVNMLMRIQRGWCQPMLSSNNNVLVSVWECVFLFHLLYYGLCGVVIRTMEIVVIISIQLHRVVWLIRIWTLNSM